MNLLHSSLITEERINVLNWKNIAFTLCEFCVWWYLEKSILHIICSVKVVQLYDHI